MYSSTKSYPPCPISVLPQGELPLRPYMQVHRLNRPVVLSNPSLSIYVPVHRLNRRRLSKGAKEKAKVWVMKRRMEMKNLKLYMENQSIIEENEKLRKKALLLHIENKALLSQLQNLSHIPEAAN